MPDNFLLLTYDSCRYDVLVDARTPVLDSHGDVHPAETPGNFTYAAHMAFFAGILPNSTKPIRYYNRYCHQLLGLLEAGEWTVAKSAGLAVESECNVVAGLADIGYQTVGAGAMNWFRQTPLREGFQKFRYTGRGARKQVDYLLAELDVTRPFFGFINFGETHHAYKYEGKTTVCPVEVRSRMMTWPPVQGEDPVGRDCPAYAHQVEAAEFLDGQLGNLLRWIPEGTVVVLCGDHGECFGEDGYWGHGVNHRKVQEVPLSIFRIGGPL